MPYIEYAVNKDFIAKYLCVNKDIPNNSCQGKCYLRIQLQKNSENNDSDQNDSKDRLPNFKTDDHLLIESFTQEVPVTGLKMYLNYSIHTLTGVFITIFVPPEN
jgi:hypothetical protein